MKQIIALTLGMIVSQAYLKNANAGFCDSTLEMEITGQLRETDPMRVERLDGVGSTIQIKARNVRTGVLIERTLFLKNILVTGSVDISRSSPFVYLNLDKLSIFNTDPTTWSFVGGGGTTGSLKFSGANNFPYFEWSPSVALGNRIEQIYGQFKAPDYGIVISTYQENAAGTFPVRTSTFIPILCRNVSAVGLKVKAATFNTSNAPRLGLAPESGKVDLEWTRTDVSHFLVDELRVYRSESPGEIGTLIGTVAPTSKTFSDLNAKLGVTHYYRVRAFGLGNTTKPKFEITPYKESQLDRKSVV